MAQTNYTPISLYYSATASATPSAGNLVAGELAINTNDGKLFYKDSSNVVQTLASKSAASGTFPQVTIGSTQLGAGNASAFKNRIINGEFKISQYNAGSSVTPSSGLSYPIDRFYSRNSVASKYTVQQLYTSPPANFIYYLGITSASAYSVLSTDTFTIGQRIEGFNVSDLNYGLATAKTITLSFQVYSSLTGTFGGALQNNAQNRSYAFSYSIPTANTWTTISITIAGDTTGTWATGSSTGLDVLFGLGQGSTFSTTAGSWGAGDYRNATGATSVVGTSGATFYITGVQLEVGSYATGFDYRSYGTELSLCQRYYSYDTYVIWSGNVTSGSTYYMYKNFVVAMRASPTMSYTANGASNFPATASTTNQSTFQQVSFQRIANGTGAGYFVDSITMSAEL
jgi:hypothetical protein